MTDIDTMQFNRRNTMDDFTTRTLAQILTAQADRAELDKQIAVLLHALATHHGVASYPPARD
jgi:hypothetical protein